jgi:glycosyltransferase involved in cell wall biosynthesis
VTVVIPAFNSQTSLPYTLASLAAQTYPDGLLEVVIADDGSSPPVELPPIRPERTRVVMARESWGRANACKSGAEAARGDVILWLDSDMLLHHDHVEAQLRWHHLVDYAVVLGSKVFVEPADGLPGVETVAGLLADKREAVMFADQWSATHGWIEELYARTDDLNMAGERAYMAHVGATASVSRALYLESGGYHAAFKLGEDIELGYRLSQLGAAFIPDRHAKSWHLGKSLVMKQREEVNKYNEPFLVDRVSQLRRLRQSNFRNYAVPYVQIVIDARGRGLVEVKATVDAALMSSIRDVRCLLLGDWQSLGDQRVLPLSDPDREARLIQATYHSEPRVHLVDDAPPTAFPSAFRVTLPVGWRPLPDFLGRITTEMNKKSYGLHSVLMADGSVARIERTAAFLRAHRLRLTNEDVDQVVEEVAGSKFSHGPEEGFLNGVRPLAPEVAAQSQGRERPTEELSPGHEAIESTADEHERSSWWAWMGIERRTGRDRRSGNGEQPKAERRRAIDRRGRADR